MSDAQLDTVALPPYRLATVLMRLLHFTPTQVREQFLDADAIARDEAATFMLLDFIKALRNRPCPEASRIAWTAHGLENETDECIVTYMLSRELIPQWVTTDDGKTLRRLLYDAMGVGPSSP